MSGEWDGWLLAPQSGHHRLARQMTLLMAVCNYVGNCVKDVVCAPRPPSPPVRRFVVSHAEKGAAQEYGLPSSHTINTLCLSFYLLHAIGWTDSLWFWTMASILVPAVVLVMYSRLYLGMHAPVDVIAGAVLGVLLLLTWILVDEAVDDFVTGGLNGEQSLFPASCRNAGLVKACHQSVFPEFHLSLMTVCPFIFFCLTSDFPVCAALPE